MASTDGDAITQWSPDGNGLIMRSPWHVAPLLKAGSLVRVLTDHPTPSADIRAVYPTDERLPRRIDDFTRHVGSGLAARIGEAAG